MTIATTHTADTLYADRLARVALGASVVAASPTVARMVAEHGAMATLAAHLDADTSSKQTADDAERALTLADQRGIRFVIPSDDEWPTQLAALAGCEIQNTGGVPLGLWVRGPVRLNQIADSLAVVGSRAATSYGAEVANKFGAAFGCAGRAVVSGAAFGIDQAAHRGAVAVNGTTVAVLACGVDRAYPLAHQSLLERIAETGAVVSEFAPGTSPTRLRFLARNRIIAALATGTVIVEAAVRSGALNAANWTGKIGRPLYGVPGPITSAPSEGVHQLIRHGAARMVTHPDHVLES